MRTVLGAKNKMQIRQPSPNEIIAQCEAQGMAPVGNGARLTCVALPVRRSKTKPPFRVRVEANGMLATYELSARHLDTILKTLNTAHGRDDVVRRMSHEAKESQAAQKNRRVSADAM